MGHKWVTGVRLVFELARGGEWRPAIFCLLSGVEGGGSFSFCVTHM